MSSSTPAPVEPGQHRAISVRRLSFVVVLLSMVVPFSIDAYLPSLPDIARDLNSSDFYLQQTLSLYMIAFAVMQLVYGPLSDAFGRRSVVLVSSAVYVLTSIGCALAPNAHALVMQRIGQGLAASGGLVISRALLRDAFSGAHAQRIMSRIMMMFLLAPALAPVVGGWLHERFGWRSVFWFLALLGAVVWVAVLLFLNETLPASDRYSSHPRAIAAAYWRALRLPRFVALISVIALIFGGMFLYVAGSPTLLYRHLQFGVQDFWILFMPLVGGLMLGAFISGRIAGRYTHAQAVKAGFGIMLCAGTINLSANLLFAPSVVTVVLPATLYASGMSLAMPNLTLLAIDLMPRNRGLASALQGFVHTIMAAAVAGLLAPLVAAHTALFAVGSLSLCLGGFLCWRLAQRFSP